MTQQRLSGTILILLQIIGAINTNGSDEMSCIIQLIDKSERQKEMLELVQRNPSEVCVRGCVCLVCVCVLELAGPVSVHALKPVTDTAALSSCFSLKLPDITADNTHNCRHTRYTRYDLALRFQHCVKKWESCQKQYFLSESEVCCYQSPLTGIFSLCRHDPVFTVLCQQKCV